jgi:hypothetical protein
MEYDSAVHYTKNDRVWFRLHERAISSHKMGMKIRLERFYGGKSSNLVRQLLLGMILCLILAVPVPCLGEIAPIMFRDGQAMRTPTRGAISLYSQHAIIRLKKKSFSVDAVYRFFNSGETTREWIGLAKKGSGVAVPWNGSLSNYGFISFEASVNNRKVDFIKNDDVPGISREASDNPKSSRKKPSWWCYVSQVTFPGKTESSIRIKYELGYELRYPRKACYYVIAAGPYWKGNIRKAVIVIDSASVGGTSNVECAFQGFWRAPSQRLLGKNLVKYETVNFVPTTRGLWLHIEMSESRLVNPKGTGK